MTRMTPAAQYAALKAIKAGIDAALADTAESALADHHAEGIDRWRTPYGSVTVATRKPTAGIVDDAAFLAWARANAPGEIVETVRDSFRHAIERQLRILDDGTVVHSGTGEAVPWAGVNPAGRPYLSVRDAAAAKESAIAMVTARLDELARLADVPEVEP